MSAWLFLWIEKKSGILRCAQNDITGSSGFRSPEQD